MFTINIVNKWIRCQEKSEERKKSIKTRLKKKKTELDHGPWTMDDGRWTKRLKKKKTELDHGRWTMKKHVGAGLVPAQKTVMLCHKW